MDLLSRLLLVPRDGDFSPMADALHRDLSELSREEFDDILALAHLNHVTVRGMDAFLSIASDKNDNARAEWAQAAHAAELSRIGLAVDFLEQICEAFEGQ